LFLAAFYALFSGWGLPAQRTLLMLLVVVVLRVSARHWHGVLVWLTACAVVLAWDPWALLQPGFWLSFVAVGVLMASDPQAQRQSGLAPERDAGDAPTWHGGASPEPFSHRFGALRLSGWLAGCAGWWTLLWSKLGSLLKEQAKITLALAPLTLLFFGQVSLLGNLGHHAVGHAGGHFLWVLGGGLLGLAAFVGHAELAFGLAAGQRFHGHAALGLGAVVADGGSGLGDSHARVLEVAVFALALAGFVLVVATP
jgi:hypothetical protein